MNLSLLNDCSQKDTDTGKIHKICKAVANVLWASNSIEEMYCDSS